MSMTLRLPFVAFKRLLVPNACKLSSTAVRHKRDDVLEALDEEDSIAISQRKAKIIDTKVNSMRLDMVLKAGLGLSRGKVEQIFYESRILQNGQKAKKKSAEVAVGDVIDVINTEQPPPNPKFINVSRLKVIDAELEDDKYSIQMLRDKNLIIEDESRQF